MTEIVLLQPSPLFLQRNLTYVKYKKTRGKRCRRRSGEKVHSVEAVIDQLVEKRRGLRHYVTFTFAGYHDGEADGGGRFAEVQLIDRDTNSIVSNRIQVVGADFSNFRLTFCR